MNNAGYFRVVRFLQIPLVFAVIFGLGVVAILADTHYVRTPETCTNTDLQSPYTSWDTAATNIQWAVNAASGGETVWVSNGTYCLTNQVEITNNITVQSTNGYSNTLVYAGWPTWTTRCFYVVNTGVVDGFTISNGHFMGSSNDYSGGGGAFVTTNGMIQNCYFRDNICSNDGKWTGGGGAFIKANGIVSNCIFFTNTVYKGQPYGNYQVRGGGVYVYGSGTVVNCTIISNRQVSIGAGGGGVGIELQGLVSNCFIAYNSGSSCGGLFLDCYDVYPPSSCGAANCIISNNYGYGVQNEMGWVRDCLIINNIGKGVFDQNAGSFSNCVIVGNASSSEGGGLFLRGCSCKGGCYPTLDNCVISNNTCTGGKGGGGVYIENAAVLRNCLIANNTNTSASGYGGGILTTNAGTYARGTSGVYNCTIVNNYSANEGGGICAVGSTTNYIMNCIVASNRSAGGSYSNIYNKDAVNSNFYYNSCAPVTNTDLFAPGQGNITNDPRFVGPSAGNWRLANNSPCINTGTNRSWMTNSYDLDGRTRIRYGRIDMGAYECIQEAPTYNFW